MKKLLLLAVLSGVYANHTIAQTLFNRIKDKVAQTAAKKMEKQIDKASSEKSGDAASSDDDTNSAGPVSTGSSVSADQESSEESTASVKLESRTKFDFVPAEKVVLWEDFANENIGEFPSRWFTRSKGETVTLNTAPGKWMRMYPGGFLSPTVDMKGDYTVEFDLIMDMPLKGGFLLPSFGVSFYDRGVKNYVFSYDYTLENNMSFYIAPYRSEASVSMSTRENRSPKFDSEKVKIASFDQKSGKVIHVSISVQKERLRMWLDEEKVFDVPGAAPYPGNLNQLKVEMNESNYTSAQIGYYVSNFKIATGSSELKSKLETDGKISTTGIQFDSNSDNIRNESYGTINEIVKVIRANPGMKIRIVGHTDNVGAAADNLILSKKRADAVVKLLIESYQVPATQLQADGKGSTQPVADNKTAEGKASNRRVEFVKM